MDRVRLALVGAGQMANDYHYPSLAEMDDVEIVGICDLVQEKLNKTADRFGIEQRFSDYRKMLERVDAHAVYVLVSPHHLFDIAVHCLQQKFHLYVEKPPGVMTYQTRAMAACAEENGCLSMVAFNRRYIPLLNEARSFVQKYGEISQCVATWYKDRLPKGMYFNGAMDILYCDTIHALDAMRWMAGGNVVNVRSSVRKLYAEYENSWHAIVEFDSGCVGILLANWAAGGRVPTFEMHSRGVSAFVNPDEEGHAYVHDSSGVAWTRTATEAAGSDEYRKSYGFFQENRHFVDCVKEGALPMTHFGDAVKSMELADLIYRNVM